MLSNIMDLNVVSERISNDRILLVGDFDNIESLQNHLLNINHNYRSILLSDVINFPKVGVDLQNPILAVLEPNCTFKLIYVDSKNNIYSRQDYINDILLSYFK